MTAATAATAWAPRRAPDRQARLRACTILLVDDEMANLDLLEALLEGEGYGAAGGGRLLRTPDPREVPALVAAHAPDLVLLDLHMPHRHGLEVLAELHASTPAGEYRPVLVLTADATWEARERALALGARDFVTKPFDAGEVLLRVENLLDARTLHVGERRARERAEAAEARAALLAEWSGLLAASLDPATALGHLPRLVVPRWGAACAVAFPGMAAGAAPPAGALVLEAPIATGDGPVGTLAIAVDAPHHADQALVDALAVRAGLAAEHARLLAAAELATRERERLLAVVAHDLRNPLGAVGMYAEMLASLQPDVPPDDDPRGVAAYTRTALATIHASTRGMQRLVEDLLDVSALRGEALRVHRTAQPVGEPFEAAARMLRPLAEAAGVTLVIAPEGDAAAQVGPLDGARVVQLLSNLVGNALRFTPAGGTVTVRYAVADAALEASVADTGPGIAPDELPHLFAAFWRGDRGGAREDGRGAGLGLWIARGIAEAHGGTLRVDPRPGPGATFHFTLPFAAAARRRED